MMEGGMWNYCVNCENLRSRKLIREKFCEAGQEWQQPENINSIYLFVETMQCSQPKVSNAEVTFSNLVLRTPSIKLSLNVLCELGARILNPCLPNIENFSIINHIKHFNS